MPRVFRGEQPIGPQPGDIREYKSRSMVQEYRGLAIVFAVLALALAVYFISSMLRAPSPAPPPVQSVYIETLPRNGPAPQNAPEAQKDPPAAPRLRAPQP
jgi:Na+-transporting methylmalonyl-CoA/oxaloacetate decarboxylase gamma subunit